ncbi:MAG: oligosaccharide flippase family protein [Anaerolineae bacterium]|nr:oligosaccharide flippase family protein [Anaerolineae bacterium]
MTTGPASNLKNKATRGILWSLGENVALQGVQFLISIVLTRLLLPEQFGLVGMLTLFMVVAQTLTIGGFGSALIQKKDASHLDACSIFYFNLAIGVVLTVALFAAAPLVAQFYQEPLLTPLTRILSFNIVINALSFVPMALLAKRIDFKPLA